MVARFHSPVSASRVARSSSASRSRCCCSRARWCRCMRRFCQRHAATTAKAASNTAKILNSSGIPPWRLYIERQGHDGRGALMGCIDRHRLELVVPRRQCRNMNVERARGVPLSRQAEQPVTQLRGRRAIEAARTEGDVQCRVVAPFDRWLQSRQQALRAQLCRCNIEPQRARDHLHPADRILDMRDAARSAHPDRSVIVRVQGELLGVGPDQAVLDFDATPDMAVVDGQSLTRIGPDPAARIGTQRVHRGALQGFRILPVRNEAARRQLQELLADSRAPHRAVGIGRDGLDADRLSVDERRNLDEAIVLDAVQTVRRAHPDRAIGRPRHIIHARMARRHQAGHGQRGCCRFSPPRSPRPRSSPCPHGQRASPRHRSGPAPWSRAAPGCSRPARATAAKSGRTATARQTGSTALALVSASGNPR